MLFRPPRLYYENLPEILVHHASSTTTVVSNINEALTCLMLTNTAYSPCRRRRRNIKFLDQYSSKEKIDADITVSKVER